MNFTRTQIIIIGIVGFIVLILLLVFLGILPGLKKEDPAKKIRAALEFWGVFDEIDAYNSALESYRAIYPGVTVNYRRFSDVQDYESALLDALAAGKGPDIFMINSKAFIRDVNKIVPVRSNKFSILGLRNLFPQVVETDFVKQGAVYALPLSIDTLVLFYNQDFFNKAAITSPPKTWEEFKEAVSKITLRDKEGNLERAGAAIGGSLKSIENAPDILSLLMLQSGTKMVSNDLRRATFNSKEGEEALGFYAKFADRSSPLYTWNDSLNSLKAFSEEKLAIFFGYASAISKIKAKNQFLNFAVSDMPQPKRAEKAIAYPDYWGYAVARQSRYQNLAWDFVLVLTTDKNVARSYLQVTKRPPALRSLINENLDNPELNVFVRQALIARSWPQVEPNLIRDIFSRMIESVISGSATVSVALNKAESEVTRLMERRL